MSEFNTINPATEETLQTYKYLSDDQLLHKIQETDQAYAQWRSSSFNIRKDKLFKLAEQLKSNSKELGSLITSEMGKPLDQAISEVEKCAWVCEYYAENAEKFLSPQSIDTDATKSYVAFAPMGVVFAIMPWNFPFWQVFRFLAPTLMAGNAALLKHSPNTTACGLKIQELVEIAGFPAGVLNTLVIDIPQVEQVIAHEKVVGVTLTGSTRAGRSVAALAGQYLKKSVLELGGSDAYVMLDDADLDEAATECISGRLLNTGQSCIAAKRFIVTKKNATAFTEKVKKLLSNKSFGNPLDKPDLGSMARKDLRDQLHQQVQQSMDQGARCELGGSIPDGKGFYYPATLLIDVKKGMPAFDEELFGPVTVIIEAENEEEAIKMANDSDYGLGSAVFSTNQERALKIAEEQLEAGSAFINTFVKSDPRLPFGGIKNSGYGRELALFGIHEFVNIKTIYLK